MQMRTLRIIDLHGTEYAQCTHSVVPVNICSGAVINEPSYACSRDGSVIAGGVRWHNSAWGPNDRVVASVSITVAALRALPHVGNFNALSFDRTDLPAKGQLEALQAMADVCRYSTSITLLAFPFSSERAPKELRGAFATAWMDISNALCANVCPAFTSLDLRGANLDDSGIHALLRAFRRLFGFVPVQAGLQLKSLRLDGNHFSSYAAQSLLEFLSSSADLSHLHELSLANTAWFSAPSFLCLLNVIESARVLLKLDLTCSITAMVGIQALHRALAVSGCPLEVLALGGRPAAVEEVV